ncbi:MAG: hypothetical protein JNM79_25115 [Burkholderiales bacterium]|nr:hypothetical protein [Burkholderiales bacterium]
MKQDAAERRGAREVMNLPGRKLAGGVHGDAVSDLTILVCRRTGGSRIKHRLRWLVPTRT